MYLHLVMHLTLGIPSRKESNFCLIMFLLLYFSEKPLLAPRLYTTLTFRAHLFHNRQCNDDNNILLYTHSFRFLCSKVGCPWGNIAGSLDTKLLLLIWKVKFIAYIFTFKLFTLCPLYCIFSVPHTALSHLAI